MYQSQPALSYQSTPSAHYHQSHSPVVFGQDGSWMLPLPHPEQVLRRQLDSALRKIRDQDETILHLAALSRQSAHPLRTQQGMICPDCKQEVAHICYPHSLITSPSLQPPLNGYGHQLATTFPSPAGLQTHFSGLTPQNVFGNWHASAPSLDSSTSPSQPLYLSVTSPSGATSAYSSSPSNATHSQHYPSDVDRHLGMRDPEERKPDGRNTNQQSEFHPSQSLSAHNPLLPPFNNSPQQPAANLSISQAITSVPAPISEDVDVILEEDDRSITFNSEVERALDVSLVRSWNVGPKFHIHCLKFSNDGKYLAVGSRFTGTTKIYGVQSGGKICTLRDVTQDLKRHIHISTLCFSPDGLYLAAPGDDLVCIWEISKRCVRNVFKLHSCRIDRIDFSPDGRLIACIINFHSLQIWNRRDGSRRIFENLDRTNDIRFSPDGRYIASGLNSGDVLIRKVRTGQLVKKLVAHRQWVNSIAFTPDGTGLFSGGYDRTVKLWDTSFLDGPGSQRQNTRTKADISSGKELLHFSDSCEVDFVAVSSNGRWVVSATYQGIRIWNAYNGDLHCELAPNGEQSMAPVVNFSPIGNCLASAHHRESRFVLWRFKELI